MQKILSYTPNFINKKKPQIIKFEAFLFQNKPEN